MVKKSRGGKVTVAKWLAVLGTISAAIYFMAYFEQQKMQEEAAESTVPVSIYAPGLNLLTSFVGIFII